MPSAQIAEKDFRDGSIDIIGVLVAAGLASSRNEGRRAVEQGGVTVNGEKVTDIHTSYEKADFEKDFILRKGKKKFCKVTL